MKVSKTCLGIYLSFVLHVLQECTTCWNLMVFWVSWDRMFLERKTWVIIGTLSLQVK